MLKLTEKIIASPLRNRVFSSDDLAVLISGTAASRYSLLNTALAKNEILQLKRGLYTLNPKYSSHLVSNYYLASRIINHSYISFESALSFHQWIPEKVMVMMSAYSQTRKKTFENAYGTFDYYPISVNYYEYLTGIDRHEVQGQPFFMASPLRAICDLLYSRKIPSANLNYLTNSLRIELEEISTITIDEIMTFRQVYRSKAILDFLAALQKELPANET